jgi:hypothetical protein
VPREFVIEIPPSPAFRVAVDRQAKIIFTQREDVIRDLLGRWVSELEPVLILRRDVDALTGDRLVGIGWEGSYEPVLWAPGEREKWF